MPDGSIVTGWMRVISTSGGAPSVLSFEDNIIMGCLSEEEDVYQVFVAVDENVSMSKCVSFSVRTFTVPGIVAWEY